MSQPAHQPSDNLTPDRAQPPTGQPAQPHPAASAYPPVPPAPGAQQVPGHGPAGAPPRRSKLRGILIGSLGGLVVLCVGLGAGLYTVVRDRVTGPAEAAVNTRVEAPETVGGRRRITDATIESQLNQTLEQVREQARGETSTAAGVYGDIARQDVVMVVAMSLPVRDQQAQIDDMKRGMEKSGATVSSVTSVDAGPLGGTAQCGEAALGQVRMAFCAWADQGSIGSVTMYFKGVDAVRAEFAQIRGQVEKRG